MKRWSKPVFFFLAYVVLYIGLDQLLRTQTDGFRVHKTLFDLPEAVHASMPSPPVHEVLHQPFYFLGSGAQFYVFVSEDNQTVLKLFKHYHMWPSSRIVKKLPLPSRLEPWRTSLLTRRCKRMAHIFASCQIAFQTLAEETGVFAVRLSPCDTPYPTLTLYDKIGVKHTLDLANAPFVLQRRAEPVKGSHPQASAPFIELIQKQCRKGIVNDDLLPHRNFGLLDGKMIEIDIGSLRKAEGDSYPQILAEQSLLFQERIAKHPRQVDPHLFNSLKAWFDEESR